MTAGEPGPARPRPRAGPGLPQPSSRPGAVGAAARPALRSRRPPHAGVPGSGARSGSRLGTEGGGRGEVGAPTRKRHIRSRKDPPPEQPLFGQRLIWRGPIWLCRFRLREEGRAGGWGRPGTPSARPRGPRLPSRRRALPQPGRSGCWSGSPGGGAHRAGRWGGLRVTPGPPGRSFHIRASCFPNMAMYVTAEAGPSGSRPLK